MATAKSAVMFIHKELERVMSKAIDLESESATLRKGIETSSKTHPEAKAGLAKDPGDTHDVLEKKKRECKALNAKFANSNKHWQLCVECLSQMR